MNNNSRENEDILIKLERIRDVCLNARDNIYQLLSKQFSDMDTELSKEEMLEYLNFISHNLSTTMKSCDLIFKHYIVIPSSTAEEDLPHLLMSMKNDSLIKYEQNLLEKTKYNEDEDNLIEIDSKKENENQVRNNIAKLSKSLGDKLKDYNKKSKPNYIQTDTFADKRIQDNRKYDIFEHAKKLLNKK